MSRNWRPGQKEAFLAEAMRKGMIVGEKSLTPAAPVQKPAPPVGEKPLRRAKEPNRTEREYEAMLRRQHPGVEIRWEAITLRLAHLATYTPDYIVFLPGGAIECHEVKGGYIFPKALVKPRMAAETFPWRFVLAQKKKGGEWDISTLNGLWTRTFNE